MSASPYTAGPGRREATDRGFIEPESTGWLYSAGVDPAEVEAGSRRLLAEARGYQLAEARKQYGLAQSAEGALASLDGERVQVPAVSTSVADTVGAGDSFTAGALHHLGVRGLLGGRLTELRLDDVEEACRFGTRVAALTCSVAGPNPPWQSQLAQPATVDRA